MMTTSAGSTAPHFTPATIARWRLALWAVVAALLAAPWVAMRFTDLLVGAQLAVGVWS